MALAHDIPSPEHPFFCPAHFHPLHFHHPPASTSASTFAPPPLLLSEVSQSLRILLYSVHRYRTGLQRGTAVSSTQPGLAFCTHPLSIPSRPLPRCARISLQAISHHATVVTSITYKQDLSFVHGAKQRYITHARAHLDAHSSLTPNIYIRKRVAVASLGWARNGLLDVIISSHLGSG